MPSNLRDPDKIPDMSLDDRRDPPTGPSHPVDVSTSYQVNRHEPAQPTPAEPAPPPDWQEGDGVLAPWEPTFLYPGTIKQIIIDEAKGDQAHIEYDDGGEGQVFVYSLCPLEVKVGQEAQVRRNHGPSYQPAEIIEVSGEDVHVRYHDGSAEWTTISSLRIPCVENGPGAVAMQPAPWQAPVAAPSSGIPSWVIWIGISILLAFVRITCREMARN